MLIFTYKLERYIHDKIIPLIVLGPKYKIVGSFERKIPYVANIEIINDLEGVSKVDIYGAIKKIAESTIRSPNFVRLVYITSGSDHSVPIQWLPEQIMQNHGNPFLESIENGCLVILHYIIDIKSIPVAFDVKVVYDQCSRSAKIKNTKPVLQENDYYYKIFPLIQQFHYDVPLKIKLENLVEKKLGLYKQLLIQIDTYHLLYTLQRLDIKTATNIVIGLVQSIELSIPELAQSNSLRMIKLVAIDNSPLTKISEWDILLKVLYGEILSMANIISKDYYYQFLNML